MASTEGSGWDYRLHSPWGWGVVAASGLLRSMLFRVRPLDPPMIVLAVAAVVILSVAASCCLRCALHLSIR